MNSLEIEEHQITEDIEYFGHLEPFKSQGLPTNSIIFKTLPGFGATYWEIAYSGRNSIIIEPNVPVIKGKSIKHSNILAVHKGISTNDVKAYLGNDTYPKKIVTTPEGYNKKVKLAIESHSDFNLFKDFFILFDECDKLITDVNYRAEIVAPIDDFFQFENKALVSATPITPTDDRFNEYGFKIVKITPTYNYKKDIRVISTNNIVSALRHRLNEVTENPVFIFLNSTLTIYAIIKLLGIEKESKVFCADDSVRALRILEFYKASSELDGFVKYNFLTSRYFSAVDIDLDYKPDVIMITDVFQASHSILDPATEIIQICGRFRKKTGSTDKITTNSLTHITNYKPNIKFKQPIDAIQYINSSYVAYADMVAKQQEATEQGTIDTYAQGASKSNISDFVNSVGKLDAFKIDNYLHQQRVQSYYRGISYLNEAYDQSNYFNVLHTLHEHPISDEDNMRLALAKTKIQRTEAIALLMVKYTKPSDHTVFKFYDPEFEISKLKEKYSDIVEAFLLIGYDVMKEQEFKMHLIEKLVNKKKMELARFGKSMISAIHKEFNNNNIVEEKDAIKRLKPIYIKFNFKAKVKATDIKHYFETKRSENASGNKVYKLIKPIN